MRWEKWVKEMRRWVRRHITVGEVCDGAYRGEEGVVVVVHSFLMDWG